MRVWTRRTTAGSPRWWSTPAMGPTPSAGISTATGDRECGLPGTVPECAGVQSVAAPFGLLDQPALDHPARRPDHRPTWWLPHRPRRPRSWDLGGAPHLQWLTRAGVG